ncbi:MAG: flagellar biosynthesis protein FlhF [Pirellulaceae bacterium]
MEIKTYRAKSLQEALRWIRHDLGPDAAVLHTRELRGGLLGWLGGGRQLEVTAASGVRVPSRFAPAQPPPDPSPQVAEDPFDDVLPAADQLDFSQQYRDDLQDERHDTLSFVESLSTAAPEAQPASPENARLDACDDVAATHVDQAGETTWETPPRWTSRRPSAAPSQAALQLFADLTDGDMDEQSARELIDRVLSRTSPDEYGDYLRLRTRLARLVEAELLCTGPIRVPPGGRRVVACVGPTGVGKTTTIAKLAASFHLHDQRRVGLVTMDTYRVAAVDQLRTYADIIDLPMEVVANPREMRQALAKLADFELILIDTSGHSPTDERKMQELGQLLQEARADEVQLVVSSVASLSSLQHSLVKFGAIGATHLVVTKLDEALGLGHLWPILRAARLPLTYITTGQNVPDDFAPAEARKLARRLVNMDGGQ